MKKILLTLGIIIISAPAFAACSILGKPCISDVPDTSDIYTPNLKERLAPNNLDLIKKPNFFQHEIQKPYQDILLNTEGAPTGGAAGYDSGCQFGICLPGGNLMESPMPTDPLE